MKLLINLCAHDGIISHYAGVGTIVKRYIMVLEKMLEKNNVEYKINLYTPRYNIDTFGFSNETLKMHKKFPIFQIENGTLGKITYGTPSIWKTLSINTSKEINKIDIEKYDYVITIANDTPFADMLRLLNNDKKHIKIWIPHSTGKIHLVDSSIENSELILDERIKWEKDAIDYINSSKNCYLGVTSKYIGKHLINEYGLLPEKAVNIINGEILDYKTNYIFDDLTVDYFNKIKDYDNIILSFGRAEKYKNLDATMKIGKKLKMKSVVIAQGYFKGQPLIKELESMAKHYDTTLFVDVPFYLAQYIVKNYNKNMILLIPSKKEIFGLIINEIRKMNKDNVLIVANDIGGMHEQIISGVDGVLVNLDDMDVACHKIKKYFKPEIMKELNKNSQLRLKKDYDLEKNCESCILKILKKESF